jgi:hypothetical protein
MNRKDSRISIASKAAGSSDFTEIGSTGLKRTGTIGTLYEEFLRDLYGIRAVRAYREMRDNDPVIGAMFFAIEMIARNVTWRVEGKDQEMVDFVESCTQDMSHTWEDFITESLSDLTYGWSWHEIVYKRRVGDVNDPTKRSRFTDGKIGWRKLPIRSQDTMLQWLFDDEGGIQAMQQAAPPTFNMVDIPIERSLLFRIGLHKNSPEGRSLLRNAYRPWFLKKRIEEIEAIGIERDLAGIPTIYRTAEMSKKYDATLQEIIRNVRRDEQEGLLLPLAYDDNGNKLITFELLSSAGSRQLDVSATIDRYDKRIAMTVMGDFLLMGQQAVGSFALADNKTDMFALGLGAILKSKAAVMNRIAIPRLLAVNGFKTDDPPHLVPGDVETTDLKELGAYITALAGAGAPLFPDEDLENYLRKAGNLPKKPEGDKAGNIPMPAPPRPKPGTSAVPGAPGPGVQPPEGAEVPPMPKAKKKPKGKASNKPNPTEPGGKPKEGQDTNL